VKGGRARVDGNRPAYQLNGLRWVTLLKSDDAEQVQGIRVIGLLDEDVLVNPRGLLQTAALMLPKRGGQVVLGGRLRREGRILCWLHQTQPLLQQKIPMTVPTGGTDKPSSWGLRCSWRGNEGWSRQEGRPLGRVFPARSLFDKTRAQRN